MPNNLSIDELVAVNSLLIERETCLADLSHIESSISEILGQRYPFPDPSVSLPSLKKGKRNKAKKLKKPKKAARIRRLKENEIGYRITIIESGEQKTHDLLDVTVFQDMVSNPLPNTKIESVATIDDSLQVVETVLALSS